MPRRPPRYTGFSFPIYDYYPEGLKAYSDKQLRAEYSRLRKVAEKRIARIEKSEFKDSAVIRYNKGKFKKLADIPTTSDLRHLLTDLAKFLTAGRGSLSGLRQGRSKAIESWQEKGFDFVDDSTFDAWIDFMKKAKDFVGHPYLETAREMYEEAEKRGISLDKMRDMYEEGKKAGTAWREIKDNFDQYLKEYETKGTVAHDWDE